MRSERWLARVCRTCWRETLADLKGLWLEVRAESRLERREMRVRLDARDRRTEPGAHTVTRDVGVASRHRELGQGTRGPRRPDEPAGN